METGESRACLRSCIGNLGMATGLGNIFSLMSRLDNKSNLNELGLCLYAKTNPDIKSVKNILDEHFPFLFASSINRQTVILQRHCRRLHILRTWTMTRNNDKVIVCRVCWRGGRGLSVANQNPLGVVHHHHHTLVHALFRKFLMLCKCTF